MVKYRQGDGKELVASARTRDEGRMGPAMRSLNVRQRAFVHNMIDQGMMNHTRAAMGAGYSGTPDTIKVTAYRLAHDDRIQAAIQEEARKRITSGSIMAVQMLMNIAENPVHKDQLKAVQMILDRSGLHAMSEHRVTVERSGGTPEDVVAQIKALATTMGMDPRKLLGSHTVAPVEDAEFEEITDGTEGLEDLL